MSTHVQLAQSVLRLGTCRGGGFVYISHAEFFDARLIPRSSVGKLRELMLGRVGHWCAGKMNKFVLRAVDRV